MHIDVQGAEALVLRSATRALETIDAVSVELNFIDLYENCAQIEDVDYLLRDAGFRRVALLSAFHPF